jgi:hypothetical protein
MKLVTFQTIKAYNELLKNGILINNHKYIDYEKAGKVYEWVVDEMLKKVPNKNVKYPLWAWYKYGKIKSPPKHKTYGYFPGNENQIVKITFEKNDNEVFLTNFNLYSFLLNNRYIPSSKSDNENYLKLLKEYNITEEELKAFVRKDKYKVHRSDKNYLKIIKKNYESFKKILEPGNDRIQACIWNLKIEEVISIEYIDKKTCIQVKPKNRRSYIKEYLKSLEK